MKKLLHTPALLTPSLYGRDYDPVRLDEMLKLVANAHVVEELTADGVNVALPVGACDIDMLAFVESRTAPGGIVFVPIQVVVLHANELSRNIAAARASDLLIALVRDVGKPRPMQSCAFTSAELTLVKMIDLMDRAEGERAYAGMNPQGPKQSVLQSAIEPFAMSRGKWGKKLLAIIAGNPESKPSESFG